ncbi:outer membrane protein assembly factor BamE [Acidisphaera sp. S103]|uniref:outer membrane protein assembly factor BamE domain-containing protein n=1 Tax=Acidisphaera sp. S103 TaxID=1747223 RepID=UPI00131E39C8|nr:outer membrane protein assembly factor BamE [Acidisphaera sp. S103]
MKIANVLANTLMICTVALPLAGCGGSQMGSSAVADPNKQAQIQKGVSREADIQMLFGAPNGKSFTENGDEVWTYSYSKTQVNAATYVPVVGMFAGGAQSDTSVLTVTFDRNGVVKAYGTENAHAASRI